MKKKINYKHWKKITKSLILSKKEKNKRYNLAIKRLSKK